MYGTENAYRNDISETLVKMEQELKKLQAVCLQILDQEKGHNILRLEARAAALRDALCVAVEVTGTPAAIVPQKIDGLLRITEERLRQFQPKE